MNFRIKELLKEKGITALSLANSIEMTQANMSNIMTGKTKPPIGTLQKIADALNVPVSELFDQPVTGIINCPYCGGKIKVSRE